MAYRSLPRPSSALGAKASTLCPYDLILGIALLSILAFVTNYRLNLNPAYHLNLATDL